MEEYSNEVFGDDTMKKAISFVLKECKEKEFIRLSDYYDEEAHPNSEWLYKEIGVFPKECEVEMLVPLLDWAIAYLKHKGIVTTKDLDSLLPDGEHDYEITLKADSQIDV